MPFRFFTLLSTSSSWLVYQVPMADNRESVPFAASSSSSYHDASAVAADEGWVVEREQDARRPRASWARVAAGATAVVVVVALSSARSARRERAAAGSDTTTGSSALWWHKSSWYNNDDDDSASGADDASSTSASVSTSESDGGSSGSSGSSSSHKKSWWKKKHSGSANSTSSHNKTWVTGDDAADDAAAIETTPSPSVAATPKPSVGMADDDGDDDAELTDDAGLVVTDDDGGAAPVSKLANVIIVLADDMGWNDIGYNSVANITNQVRSSSLVLFPRHGTSWNEWRAGAPTPARPSRRASDVFHDYGYTPAAARRLAAAPCDDAPSYRCSLNPSPAHLRASRHAARAQVQTPNIDSLAAQGVTLSRYYTQVGRRARRASRRSADCEVVAVVAIVVVVVLHRLQSLFVRPPRHASNPRFVGDPLSRARARSVDGARHGLSWRDALGRGDDWLRGDATPRNLRRRRRQPRRQCDCTPSRAALLTGLYPIKTGMYHNSISQDSPWGLPTKFDLLPTYLADYGYKSYAIGKWDIGHYSWAHTPTKRGFNE